MKAVRFLIFGVFVILVFSNFAKAQSSVTGCIRPNVRNAAGFCVPPSTINNSISKPTSSNRTITSGSTPAQPSASTPSTSQSSSNDQNKKEGDTAYITTILNQNKELSDQYNTAQAFCRGYPETTNGGACKVDFIKCQKSVLNCGINYEDLKSVCSLDEDLDDKSGDSTKTKEDIAQDQKDKKEKEANCNKEFKNKVKEAIDNGTGACAEKNKKELAAAFKANNDSAKEIKKSSKEEIKEYDKDLITKRSDQLKDSFSIGEKLASAQKELESATNDLRQEIVGLDSNYDAKLTELSAALAEQKEIINSIQSTELKAVEDDYKNSINEVQQACLDEQEKKVEDQATKRSEKQTHGQNRLNRDAVITSVHLGGAEGLDQQLFKTLSEKCLAKRKTRDKIAARARAYDINVNKLNTKMKLAIIKAANIQTQMDLMTKNTAAQKALAQSKNAARQRAAQSNIQRLQQEKTQKDQLYAAESAELTRKRAVAESEYQEALLDEKATKAGLEFTGPPDKGTNTSDQTKTDDAIKSMAGISKDPPNWDELQKDASPGLKFAIERNKEILKRITNTSTECSPVTKDSSGGRAK